MGPFDNRGGQGFAAIYPPEQGVELWIAYGGEKGPLRLAACFKRGRVRQRRFNRELEKLKGTVAYAYAEVESPDRRPASCRLSTDNAYRVWLNGKLVGEAEIYHAFTTFDQYIVPVTLQPGIISDRGQNLPERANRGMGRRLEIPGCGFATKPGATSAWRKNHDGRTGRLPGTNCRGLAHRGAAVGGAGCGREGSRSRAAEDWPQFRGPQVRSTASPMPGRLPGTWKRWSLGKSICPVVVPRDPIVVGDRVFVTASSGNLQDRLHVLCFSVVDGHRLWERQFWATGRTITHPQTAVAANTPADDETGVCLLLFERSGGPRPRRQPALVSRAGSRLSADWQRRGHGLFAAGGHGAGGRASRDARRRVRDGDQRRQRHHRLAGRSSAQSQLVVAGPNAAGQRTARGAGTVGGRPVGPVDRDRRYALELCGQACEGIPSPAVNGGKIYLPADGITLRPAPGTRPPEVLWKSNKLSPGAASPIAAEGKLYLVNRSGVLIAAKQTDGEILFRVRLEAASGARRSSAAITWWRAILTARYRWSNWPPTGNRGLSLRSFRWAKSCKPRPPWPIGPCSCERRALVETGNAVTDGLPRAWCGGRTVVAGLCEPGEHRQIVILQGGLGASSSGRMRCGSDEVARGAPGSQTQPQMLNRHRQTRDKASSRRQRTG